MRRMAWWFSLLLLAGAIFPAAAQGLPPLYHEVAGGELKYEVTRKVTLPRVALEHGVQWRVLARENEIDKPYRLAPGMAIEINNTHIVPTELANGFVINLPELLLYHFKDGKYLRRYALAVGKRSWPTPTGNYHIRNKTKNPTWTVPASIQAEMEAMGQTVLEKVPPGPKNPLGDYWMGTSAPGVGIHATNRPWSVGHSVSHGCIRMLPDEIETLFPQVEVGLPVKIIYRPVKLAVVQEGRIFLEAHPNIYLKEMNYLEMVKAAAKVYGLTERMDWDKVKEVVKDREGIAEDVTKGPPVTADGAAAPENAAAGEARLTPVREPETRQD